MNRFTKSLPFRLLLGLIIGMGIGLVANETVMKVLVPIKYVMGQVINFCVPLIIIGFVAPSIIRMGKNASRMLLVAVSLAYASSVLAALLSMAAGYLLVPHLSIATNLADLRQLPAMAFQLDIPPVMSVMTALVMAVFFGLAVAWTKSAAWGKLFEEFQEIILSLVQKILIPLLPFFIGTTFATLAYEGTITRQLPVFLLVILIVMLGHYLWLAVLYGAAGAYSKKNPWNVVKNYGPAYLTAVGTMSSAATLAVALKCAKQSSPTLRSDLVDFGIPLFSNIHLCGSVLTETFFVMVVSQMLYGKLPNLSTMILFCLLLGIFAIGAPGVPGGTVMASLGLITGVLLFDEAGTAMVLAVFALQDSFGTACNITGDGALTLMLTGYAQRHHIADVSDLSSVEEKR